MILLKPAYTVAQSKAVWDKFGPILSTPNLHYPLMIPR